MEESEEEPKNLLMKKESEKAVLKLSIPKTKVMASSPITSWKIDWERVEKAGLKFNIQKTKIMTLDPPLHGK